MPLMRQWVEITVGEDLLIPVVRELLDMAADPNQVEVVHGDVGRVILAEVHLAEHWFQERLKQDTVNTVPLPEEDFVVSAATEVEPPALVLEPTPEPVTEPVVVMSPAPLLAPPPPALVPPRPPVRRTTSTKPSASLNGEEQ